MTPAAGRTPRPSFGPFISTVALRNRLPYLLAGFCLSLSALSVTANATDPAPVRVSEARLAPVSESLELTGSITAPRAAALSASVAGLVTQLSVDDGTRVENGDVLLQMDSELVELALQAARARADEARAHLSDARRRLEEATALKEAVAASQVATLEAEAEQAEAMLAAALADEARQAALLDRHRVHSPFSGVISARHVDVGEWLQPGDALFDLVATEDLRADFQVAQRYLHRLGDTARLSVKLEGSTEEWPGAIVTRVPVLDPASRTFLLRARVPDDAPFAPGMAVRATLTLPAGREALTVSRDALLRYPDGRVSVWVAEPENGAHVAREVSVRVEPGLGMEVVVESGLEAGDLVVVRGNEALRGGQPLRILD